MKPKPFSIFSTRIDPKIHEEVKEHCIRKNQKIQGFTEQALIDRLDKEGRYGLPNEKRLR